MSSVGWNWTAETFFEWPLSVADTCLHRALPMPADAHRASLASGKSLLAEHLLGGAVVDDSRRVCAAAEH